MRYQLFYILLTICLTTAVSTSCSNADTPPESEIASPIPVETNEYSSKNIQEDEPISEALYIDCLLYTSPSPRDRQKSRMPSSA